MPDMGTFDLSVGELPASGTHYATFPISQPQFELTFALPETSQQVLLSGSHYVKVGGYFDSFIKPKRIYLIDLTSYVYADAIERTYRHGLRRIFSVRSERARDFHPTAAGRYTLEIPMVYSRFLVGRQNGNLLPTWSDFNYRLNVQVNDLSESVEVVY